MEYTLIGDCHGKTKQLLEIVKTKKGRVLQLGDMGLGFSGVSLPNLHKDFGFIRGNHDGPDDCRMHPNYAGEYGPWNGIYVVGGAYSIDYMYRVPGESWWPNEELSQNDLDAMLGEYIRLKPRIVASHDAPQGVGQALLNDGGFRMYKMSSTTSRTAMTMQRMWEHYQPEQWYFGHYHRDWAMKMGGTHFECLNELSTKTIEVE